MKWGNLIIALILTSLFSLALITFTFQLQETYNINDTILDNPAMVSFNSSINTQISNFRSDVADQKNATEAEIYENPEGDITVASIFASLTRFGRFIVALPIAIFNLAISILGLPTTIMATISAIIVFIAGLYWWRLIKQAD